MHHRPALPILLAILLAWGCGASRPADDAGVVSFDAGNGVTDAGRQITDAGDQIADAGGPSASDAGEITTDGGIVLPDPADFSQQTWTVAFDAMHEKFSREYAFTSWKGIDWDQLRATYRPRVVAAEANNDEKAYYLAIREYVFSIHDGHIALDGSDRGTMKAAIGGGTGFVLAELDDGRIIVKSVIVGSPAAIAAVPPGSEILQWQGLPVRDAIAATSTLWTDGPMATNEGFHTEALRLLTRAPVGAAVSVTYTPPGATAPVSVSLTAAADAYAWLEASDPTSTIDQNHTVQSKILPQNIGYVRVEAEYDLAALAAGDSSDATTVAPVYNAFQQAIQSFVDANVIGVIVDLRANTGGDDGLSRELPGFFYDTPAFFERGTFYDELTGQFESPPGSTTEIEPQQPHYSGPVVCLVDYYTLSSAEGIAMGIQRSPHGMVVGENGTFGAFGETGGDIRLPLNLDLSYPYGQSLDDNGRIQIDSDATGQGGILPNMRIPRTFDSVMKAANGEDVDLDFAVSVLQGMQ